MKNNVAVQYHFQSIEQLFDEVVKFRMAQLEEIRSDALRNAYGNDLDKLAIHELMALICLPHLAIRAEDGRYPYASFLCHYLPERRPFGFEWVMEAGDTLTPLAQTIIGRIRGKLLALPDMIFNRRMTNATLAFLNILRGFSSQSDANDNLAHHPLILDGMRQSVAILETPWIEPASDRN